MLFVSPVFVFLFLPAVLAGYHLVFRFSRNLQNAFLFVSSMFFYAWGEPAFSLVLLLSIALNWASALGISALDDKPKLKKLLFAVSLTYNLGLLFVYKYLNFTIENLNKLFASDVVFKTFVLPIGISFFTFQAISYVADVYRGTEKAQKNPLNVGLYISMFPQLIAGPIVRYGTIADQIKNRRDTADKFSEGALRFMTGFAKKMLIANSLAVVADTAFSLESAELTVTFAWLGAAAYAFQIYYDFSGYSDMAIGLGRMFGFEFEENFNYPYVAGSITEFWRRWHISLSTFFRDYVYIPLGGNRSESSARRVFNLFAVWLLTGIWHGANWTFIVWGLAYFALLLLERTVPLIARLQSKKVLGHVYTLFFVVVLWVVFRAESLSAAGSYIGAMFGGAESFTNGRTLVHLREFGIYFAAAALFSFPAGKLIKGRLSEKKASLLTGASAAATVLLFAVSILYMFNNAYSPFLYFNF